MDRSGLSQCRRTVRRRLDRINALAPEFLQVRHELVPGWVRVNW